jgi:hypothetical protein
MPPPDYDTDFNAWTEAQAEVIQAKEMAALDIELGLFPGLRLARSQWRAAAGDGELCSQPEPVLYSAAVRGPCWWSVAVAGSNGRGDR